MSLMHREHTGSLVRSLVAALLGAALLLAPASAYAADTPSIAYDGNARQLTVSGVEAPSDLFPAFKDLMPGDTREQPIKIEAKGVQGQVSIFVSAVVDEDTARAPEPISLTATVSAGPSSGVLETGTPTSVFAETTKIATFATDGNATLDLRLNVPISVGNELADAAGQVAKQRPQKNGRTIFLNHHTVAVVGFAVHAVRLLVTPVNAVNSTGNPGQKQHDNVVWAVFAVTVKDGVQVFHINIPEVDRVESARQKCEQKIEPETAVVFYIHL